MFIRGVSRRGFITGCMATATAGAAGVGASAPALAAPPGGPPASDDALIALEQEMLEHRPAVFLLESQVPPSMSVGEGSSLDIDPRHAKIGHHSLLWGGAGGRELVVETPIGFDPERYDPDTVNPGGSVQHFAAWIYQEAPCDEALTIQFCVGSRVACWVDVQLAFTGWRTVWVRYGYDTEGVPEAGMDRIILQAPAGLEKLWLDEIIVNSSMRGDHVTADRQVGAALRSARENPNYHWLGLLDYADHAQSPGFEEERPGSEETQDLSAISERLRTRLRTEEAPAGSEADDLEDLVDQFGVPAAEDAAATAEDYAFSGPGVFIDGYQSAIWPSYLRQDLLAATAVIPLRDYTDACLTAARQWESADRHGDQETARRAGDQYVRLVAYFGDQGFAAGSAQGTVHHSGYQLRGWFNSLLLARDLLIERGHWDSQHAALCWYTGLGRLLSDFEDLRSYSGLADVLNTLLQGLEIACVTSTDAADGVARLRALHTWSSHACSYSPGTLGGFKPDGTLFHHMGAYAAYGRDALLGSVPVVLDLRGTAFGLGHEQRDVVQEAMMTLRRLCHSAEFPISFSARHPTGTDGLNGGPVPLVAHYGRMAAEPLDGGDGIDREMAAVYRRLVTTAEPTDELTALDQDFERQGVEPEPAPQGAWQYGYAAAAQRREDEWSATVRGHNHHLWSTEIYASDNVYGRYQTYGQIEVQGTVGSEGVVTHQGDGWVQPGYDWNHVPGATTRILPFDELRSTPIMPMTRSAFGGGGTLGENAAIFGMALREDPSFDASHRALVSVLAVGDRVIALGSDIHNEDGDHPTRTTLYQRAAGFLDDAVPPEGGASWSVDPVGHGFVMLDGELTTRTAPQTCPDQSGKQAATESYSLGWIDHGAAPEDAGYAYVQLIGAGPDRTREVAAACSGPADDSPVRVHQRDAVAHVVEDVESGIWGHVVFTPEQELGAESIVRSASRRCLIASRQRRDGLEISITDPDLHLASDDGGDGEGGGGPYVQPWRGNSSPETTTTVTVRAPCRHVQGPRGVQVSVRPAGDDLTEITVTAADARSVQLVLR